MDLYGDNVCQTSKAKCKATQTTSNMYRHMNSCGYLKKLHILDRPHTERNLLLSNVHEEYILPKKRARQTNGSLL